MIMDHVAEPIMWNIFFHMYLDLDSSSTLVSQSQKLAAYDSMDSWRSSGYGAIIKIGTDHTLAELRHHWKLYAAFYHPSKRRRLRVELQAAMDDKLKHEAAIPPKDDFVSIRSSGLLFQHSQTTSLFNDLHHRYWKTGTTFTDDTRLAASTRPNSTFLYSRAGEGFRAMPNTDPIIVFAHDVLFGNAGDRTLTVEDLVESAQSQFRTWCSAFQTATTEKTGGKTTPVVVRFLLGDALAVAHALLDFTDHPAGGRPSHPRATSMVPPWTAFPIELNREEYIGLSAPTRFDAIDTSNISDHLGLLNLFLATAPLLTRASSSVLYTGSLALFSADPTIEFEATLFATLPVVAILMDLAPIDVLSGFSSTYNGHELFTAYYRPDIKPLFRQSFTWKRPSSGDPLAYPDGSTCVPVSFSTHQFAKLLYTIYLDMFRSEDPIHASAINKALNVRNDAEGRALLQGLLLGPCRKTFFALLSFIRDSLQISEEQWSGIMRSFLEMRSENQPHFDKLTDSDVDVQLYLYGLHTVPRLYDVSKPSTASEPGRLSFWPSVPPLICIFLTVPRDAFAKLERAIAGIKGELLLMWLHCVIDHGDDQNVHIFQSVNAAYGIIIDTGTASEPSLTFQEDPEGNKNGADVVFSFVAPSHLFQAGKPPAPTMVRLQVRDDVNTPLILGPGKAATCIFSANVEDTDHVYLLPEPQPLRPGRPSSQDPAHALTRPDETGDIGYQHPVHVELDSTGKNIASLTAKLEITNAAALAVFAGGTMPTVSQCSPCAVQVVLGSRKQIIAFPVPIVGSPSRRKLRIARKSSYIEVVVPVAIPFLEPDGYKVNQFPVVGANGSLVPWNIHRVSLDQLPVLDRANISDAQLECWYGGYLSQPCSRRERIAFDDDLRRDDPLVNVKMTTSRIMMEAAGVGAPPQRVFGLKPNPRKDPDTFLFVDKIRYETASHNMVLDAFVLVLSEDVLSRVKAALPHLAAGPAVMHSPVLGWEREMYLWRRILPALAERCRTTWTHGADCEYRVVQADGSVRWQVPRELSKGLGDSYQGDPLCSCGRGRDVNREGIMGEGAWRVFAPFVTRIALSPLFSVAHVEHLLEPLDSIDSLIDLDNDDEGIPCPGPQAPAPVGAVASKTKTNPDVSGGGADGDSSGKSVLACDKCKKRAAGDVKLLKCARCKTALYCSQACQKGDWKAHKLQCKNMQVN
ncbi:hypothetical protein GSI_10215 [Ganoderma sinense ZZ0214-1]|uniref:MYND-type domain-containing protein n=1 Tax=Ganoderma sinense ZZ0214-1 TaxID=1077348 RepID=A0A2G8RZY4_9APHY|nr:hypothetical protein GSI_10215 [Ganoderma sinense ZZ0214-1]